MKALETIGTLSELARETAADGANSAARHAAVERIAQSFG